MFLLDAEAFRTLLQGAPADSAAAYGRFVEIVDMYIREYSQFEVNIECKTRNEILEATDRKTFLELTQQVRNVSGLSRSLGVLHVRTFGGSTLLRNVCFHAKGG